MDTPIAVPTERDVEPGQSPAISSFMTQLDKRYPQWVNMNARTRELRQSRAARGNARRSEQADALGRPRGNGHFKLTIRLAGQRACQRLYA